MKLILFTVVSGILANNLNDFARQLGKLVSTRGFADWVSGRIGDVYESAERSRELAQLAASIYEDVYLPTLTYLKTKPTAGNILSQLDGMALTMDSYKQTACNEFFGDEPKPCTQVVDAVSSWSSAEMCARFAAGLDPKKAAKYGVCQAWVSNNASE